MTARAAECAKCKHWKPDALSERKCLLGHRPRFYLYAYTGGKRNPGYRRRCEDFEPKEGR